MEERRGEIEAEDSQKAKTNEKTKKKTRIQTHASTESKTKDTSTKRADDRYHWKIRTPFVK